MLLRRLAQVPKRTNPKPLVQDLRPLGAQPGNGNQIAQAGRDLPPQLLAERQITRFHNGSDLACQVLADPREIFEFVGR